LADWRKHFLIPVRALFVIGGLLHLHDLAIFGKYPAGERGQHRPGQIEQAGNFGAGTDSTTKVRLRRCAELTGG
jgi:hypothetical protein